MIYIITTFNPIVNFAMQIYSIKFVLFSTKIKVQKLKFNHKINKKLKYNGEPSNKNKHQINPKFISIYNLKIQINTTYRVLEYTYKTSQKKKNTLIKVFLIKCLETGARWWSPSWARMGHGPSRKIKKLTIIGLFCEILYNFVSVLGFG
jgi:hypothetical protein